MNNSFPFWVGAEWQQRKCIWYYLSDMNMTNLKFRNKIRLPVSISVAFRLLHRQHTFELVAIMCTVMFCMHLQTFFKESVCADQFLYILQYSKCSKSKISNTGCLQNTGLDKQCRTRSDCFWRCSLIRIFPLCYSDKHFVNASPENQPFI